MLTLKQIDGRIPRLRGRYANINNDVQEIAVSLVHHANATGDCDRAKRLIRAIPPKMRSMLKNWFGEVSPINVSTDGEKVSLRKEGKKNYMPFDIERAKANIWYEDPFKMEPEPELNTIETYYNSFERLFDKMERETKDGAEKVDPQSITAVQALRAHLRAAYVEFINSEDAPSVTTFDDLPDAEEQQSEEEAPAVPAGMVAAAG